MSMRQKFLAFLGVLMLAAAGGVLMAQNSDVPADTSAAPTTSATSQAVPAAGTESPEVGTAGENARTADPAATPTQGSSSSPGAKMPRTASPVPILFALGAAALGAGAGLRVYRLRRA